MPKISQNHEQEFYQNTIRVLFILYFSSDPYNDPQKKELVKIFQSEVRIQKIDFLLRYPSYLCDELMNLIDRDQFLKTKLVDEIEKILVSNEPKLKTKEMQRFFFGRY